jgi:hypothetical protein
MLIPITDTSICIAGTASFSKGSKLAKNWPPEAIRMPSMRWLPRLNVTSVYFPKKKMSMAGLYSSWSWTWLPFAE